VEEAWCLPKAGPAQEGRCGQDVPLPYERPALVCAGDKGYEVDERYKTLEDKAVQPLRGGVGPAHHPP
jgi:hypothetical protein